MKNKFTILIAVIAMMAILVPQIGWATDFTLTSADEITVDGITVSFAKGSGSNAPAWYSAGLRLYANNTVTISCANDITAVTFNWEKQGSKPFASVTASVGDYTHPSTTGQGIWSGSAKEIVFTLGSSGQLQLNTFSVTVSGGSSNTPSLSVSPTTLDFGSKEINPEEPYTETFTVTYAYLTENLTISVGAGLTGVSVSPQEISKDGDGTQVVTVSYNPTSEGEISGNITVSNTADELSKTVAVSGSSYDPANVVIYERYTDAIVEGDYIICANAEVAMKNVISSSRFANESVTVTDNKITNPDASIVWHIAADGDHWTIFNAAVGKYAGGTTSNNQGALLDEITDYARWDITYQYSNFTVTCYGRNSSNNKYLRRNGTYGWATYANNTGNVPTFYKKVGATTYSVTYDGNGNTEGTVPTDGNEYGSGDEVTVLGNTGNLAKAGYTWAGWNTQADGNGTNYTAGNTFNITASTTLYAKWNAKTITSLSYTGTPTTTSYYAGQSFDPTGLTVIATFNDNSTEDVTTQVTWTPDPLTTGTTSVTGTYMNQTINVSGLTVTDAPGTENNPYTVAQARAAIDAGTGTQGVYVTGIISEVVSYNSTYNSITYYISNDGTTTSDQLEVYSGQGLNNTPFSSIDDVEKGATVIVYGNLKKYNETYEFDYNNYLVSYTAPVVTTHTVTFSVDPAGAGAITVNGSTTSPVEVAEGETVDISATVVAGYVFSGWTVSDATVADATSANTTLTMGTTDATLTATFTQVNTYTVTYHANLQNVADIEDEYSEGEDVTVRGASTFTYEGHTITKWTANADGTGDEYTPGSTITGIADDYDLWAYWEEVSEVDDCLDYAFTGISGTSYSNWSGKTGTSGAVYAGNSNAGVAYIQLRATSPSGIVSTTSGGKVKKVTVTWNTSTQNDRTLDVYAKNTAYDGPGDLYSSATQGTILGSIVCGTSTELTIDGDYEYIGLRSNSGAMYLDEICIAWSTAPVPAITVSPDAIEAPYTQTNGTLGLTLSHMTITDAGQFEIIWCDDQGNEVDSQDRPDWIDGNAFEASISGGAHSIAYTIPANNTNSERATHFMVYGLDDDGVTEAYSNVVTITQAAAPQPAITLSSYEIEATAAETNGSLDITLENMSINSYEDFEYTFYTDNTGTTALGSKPDWIAIEFPEPTASQYTLSYSINENESSNPRTAYFTVKAPEAAGGHKAVIESEIVTVSQAGVVTAGTWVLTTLAELTPADVFVIVGNNGDTYAMSNDNGTSNAPDAVAVTVTNNTLSNPAENIQWNLIITNDGYIFYPAGDSENWLYLTNSNNGVKVGTGEAKHFTLDDSFGYLTTSETTEQRYIGVYQSTDWRCYRLDNNSIQANIAGQTFSFFKKVADPVTYHKTIENGYGSAFDQDNHPNFDYYLIAPPVASVTPSADNGFLNVNGYDLYYFNQDNENAEWINYKDQTSGGFNLVSGKGYLYASSDDNTELTFTGQPYFGNGVVNLDYTDGKKFAGWNLIGNPYANSATPSLAYYRLNQDGNALKTETENTAVAAMEGVFVHASASQTEVEFIPQSNPVMPVIPALTLQMVQNRGSVIDNAIIRFDQGQQLPKFMLNANSTKLYIPQGTDDYAIVRSGNQGEMPVNFKAERNGTYTINVNPENVEMNYLHLIDHITGAEVDLLANPNYTFEANVSDYESRFKLVFSANHGVSETESDHFAFIANGQIIVNGTGTIQVIDALGRVIVTGRDAMHCVSTEGMTPGVYVIRLINGNDTKTQKIVVK